MSLADNMAKMKETLQLTNQNLADRSGVPLSSINRITAGQTDNPGWYSMVRLAAGVGFSLDEMAGLAEKDDHFTVREKEWMLVYRALSDEGKEAVDLLTAAEYRKVRALHELDEILRESDLMAKLRSLPPAQLWTLVHYVDICTGEKASSGPGAQQAFPQQGGFFK